MDVSVCVGGGGGGHKYACFTIFHARVSRGGGIRGDAEIDLGRPYRISRTQN